jgi:hypothetical protein
MAKPCCKVAPASQLLAQKEHSFEKQSMFEEDGWVLVHNAIRGEIQLIADALQAVEQRQKPVKPWEIRGIRQAIAHHSSFVQAHHARSRNDTFVEERFQYPRMVC